MIYFLWGLYLVFPCFCIGCCVHIKVVDFNASRIELELMSLTLGFGLWVTIVYFCAFNYANYIKIALGKLLFITVNCENVVIYIHKFLVPLQFQNWYCITSPSFSNDMYVWVKDSKIRIQTQEYLNTNPFQFLWSIEVPVG